jgi:hypothetical protein
MAERGARSHAEADLARLGEETSSLIGERDRLATALETTKAELARAQAERAESEQRLREVERTRETGQLALTEAAKPAPAPCAMDDLDCRAFTGTLDWQPDETQPLLSGKTLRRLTLLRHLPGGQRERALRCLAFIAWAEARSDGIEGMRAVIDIAGLRDWVRRWEVAMAVIRRGNASEASALFETLATERPADGLAAFYAARSAELARGPLHISWDGVDKLSEK